MNVHEIMTRDPVCCGPDTPLPEVARMMKEADCGQIPIVETRDGGRPMGVVTDRDIVVRGIAEGRDPMQLRARDVMSSPVVTLSPDDTVEACERLFEDHRIRRAPVVDDRGRCCGIVAQADIARRAPERLTASMVRGVSQAPATSRRTARAESAR